MLNWITDRYYPGSGSGTVFKSTYTLPEGLTCDQCVLQWKYVAGNNWGKESFCFIFLLISCTVTRIKIEINSKYWIVFFFWKISNLTIFEVNLALQGGELDNKFKWEIASKRDQSVIFVSIFESDMEQSVKHPKAPFSPRLF